MRLFEFFDSVYSPLCQRASRPNTRRLYLATLNNFKRFLGREPVIHDLTDITVARFLLWMTSRDRSPHTVNKNRTNLLAIWRFAVRKRYLETWPDVPKEMEPIREPEAWLESEMRQLFDACERAPGMIGKTHAAYWWSALVLCLFDTSERIGGIMGLTWDRVDMVNGWLLVCAETRKGGREDRRYRISPETVAALKRIHRSPGLVFKWPYDKTYLYAKFREILVAAKLPTDRRCLFHRIRRTVASYYEAAGGNATALLGHSSRKVTMAYLDSRVVQVAAPMDKVFRLTKPPKLA